VDEIPYCSVKIGYFVLDKIVRKKIKIIRKKMNAAIKEAPYLSACVISSIC
jgi:uncharacterized protein YutD